MRKQLMDNTTSACIFYGVGSRYVHESIEIARRSNIKIEAFIDNRIGNDDFQIPGLPLPAISISDALKSNLFRFPVHIPLITPGYRKQLVLELAKWGVCLFKEFIDATAVIAASSSYGEGFAVNAGVVVGANSHFGKHVLVNRSVSIGHDARVADYVTFGPACVLCGSCRIDAGVFIGAGAVISPEVHIGENAVVGAGAVVIHDIPAGAVVAGNPAKIIKEGQPGYNGVGV